MLLKLVCTEEQRTDFVKTRADVKLKDKIKTALLIQIVCLLVLQIFSVEILGLWI